MNTVPRRDLPDSHGGTASRRHGVQLVALKDFERCEDIEQNSTSRASSSRLLSRIRGPEFVASLSRSG
jgi:hypothetical protein